jgi:hypothetical protein
MTLSEAITEAEKNAKIYEARAEEILSHNSGNMNVSMEQAKLYDQYAKDQRQIRDWLRELQRYRWASHMDADG